MKHPTQFGRTRIGFLMIRGTARLLSAWFFAVAREFRPQCRRHDRCPKISKLVQKTAIDLNVQKNPRFVIL